MAVFGGIGIGIKWGIVYGIITLTIVTTTASLLFFGSNYIMFGGIATLVSAVPIWYFIAGIVMLVIGLISLFKFGGLDAF
jgi:hypothetical protein